MGYKNGVPSIEIDDETCDKIVVDNLVKTYSMCNNDVIRLRAADNVQRFQQDGNNFIDDINDNVDMMKAIKIVVKWYTTDEQRGMMDMFKNDKIQ